MINLNCHIYRCGPNENYDFSDEDFRDTDKPTLQELVKDPAQLKWHETCLLKHPRRRQVTKVANYYLSVNAMTRPMQVRDDSPLYRKERESEK